MTKSRILHSLMAGCAVAALAGIPAALHAQEAEPEAASQVEILKDKIAELERRDAASQSRIDNLEARIAELADISDRRAWIDAQPVEADDLVVMRGMFASNPNFARPSDPSWAFVRQQDQPAQSVSGSVPGQSPAEGADDEPTLKEPAKTQAVTDVTEQQQGRFGDRLSLELGLGYTHFDDARINLDGFLALDAIFLGTISIDQVKADIFTVDPTIRYGVSDRLSLDASVPYLYRTSNFQSGGAGGAAGELIEETVSADGLGDVSVGGSFRLMQESAGRPDLVLSARAKFPTGRDPFGVEFIEVPNSEGNLQVPATLATGSGVYGASAGLSVLKTLDPMIVFGNVTYFHNFPRSFADIDENPDDQPGRVNVGNAFQFGGGLAFALNERSSISMSYSQRLVKRTRIRLEDQDWRPIVGSQANVALVNLGATFSLSDTVTLITNVGIGLTDDSPDMAVNIRVPFRF